MAMADEKKESGNVWVKRAYKVVYDDISQWRWRVVICDPAPPPPTVVGLLHFPLKLLAPGYRTYIKDRRAEEAAMPPFLR
jgi:hypothetical protein